MMGSAHRLPDNEQALIRLEKLDGLVQTGANPFEQTAYLLDAHSEEIKLAFEEESERTVRVAGRMMSRRIMGKASFFDVQDVQGRIQVYVQQKQFGDDAYAAFKQLDVGDIVGIFGTVFKTRAGEISINASEVKLLAKSLDVLPEKWHGLADTEARYRKRHLDLIANRASMDVFVRRVSIIRAVRAFLDGRGYFEVNTPILQTIAGGGAARPFETHHNALDMDMFLRVALELPLKRLIIGGMERVYELGPCFRNEGVSTRHNPEFLMLELYEAYTNMDGMMRLCEDLLGTLCDDICKTRTIDYCGVQIDFSAPFASMTMCEAIKKHGGMDFDKVSDTAHARQLADAHGVEYAPHHTKGEIMAAFFDKFAEEHLTNPTFITDYPVEISPLSKTRPNNPEIAERFELFVAGREIANAYSELNEPREQLKRFEAQAKKTAAGDAEAQAVDMDFVEAMYFGMPPTGGMGIGIDRLVMLLTNSASIRDCIFFPTMKPLT